MTNLASTVSHDEDTTATGSLRECESCKKMFEPVMLMLEGKEIFGGCLTNCPACEDKAKALLALREDTARAKLRARAKEREALRNTKRRRKSGERKEVPPKPSTGTDKHGQTYWWDKL